MFLHRMEGKSIDAIICHGGGGGGASGEVGFPVYMKDAHRNWLDGHVGASLQDAMTSSMVDLMEVAHGAGGNPYEGETAFDPNKSFTPLVTSPLGRMSAQFTASKTILDALDAQTEWKAYVGEAIARYPQYSDIDFLDNLATAISGLLTAVESALSSSSITDMVTAFENNKKVRFLRDQGMWSAGMADINAVHTSSFIMGLAIQQIEFSNSVDQYERELKANTYTIIIKDAIDAHVKAEVLRVNNKDGLISQGPEVMSNLLQLKTQAQTQLVQLKGEVERLTIVALKEQEDRQVELEVDEATWDMEVYMYGGNLLAAISGASTGRKQNQMSKGQTALGGAMGGASIGAAFGPLGAGIGFVAGGLLGWAFG